MTTDNIGGGCAMFSTETRARLRAVLDEVCAGVSRYETAARAYVASKILEAATQGETSIEGLRKVGLEALIHCRDDDVSGRPSGAPAGGRTPI
jgi:hypothetical protein